MEDEVPRIVEVSEEEDPFVEVSTYGGGSGSVGQGNWERSRGLRYPRQLMVISPIMEESSEDEDEDEGSVSSSSTYYSAFHTMV